MNKRGSFVTLLGLIVLINLAFAPLVYAQTQLFSDDFDNLNQWVTSGDVSIQGWWSHYARLRFTGSMIAAINTSCYQDINLSFDHAGSNLDYGERLWVEWRVGSSGAWTAIADFGNSNWTSESYDLGASASNTTIQIRFTVSANRDNEEGDIDDVVITGHAISNSSIGDFVYDTADNSPISGRTVELWNDNNNNGSIDGGDTQRASTATTGAADANYGFTGLPAGNYVVRALGGTGYYPTSQTHDVPTLGCSQNYDSADFGFGRTATIAGLVWYDINRNGSQQLPAETGSPNVTVEIRRQSDNSLVASPTTNASGNFTATVPAGAYTVQVVEATLPAGRTDSTTGGSSWAVTVAGGQTASHSFGYDDSGTIGDFIWDDTSNGNGDFDIGEPGLDWQVSLTDQNGVTTPQNAVAGVYNFVGLPAGTYTVTVSVPADWAQTGRSDQTTFRQLPLVVNLTTGFHDTSADFGFSHSHANISGYVWHDANRNRVRDAGEPGINAIGVDLRGGTGGVVDSVSTNADGFYFFGGLPADNYQVDVDQNDGDLGVKRVQTTPDPLNVPGVVVGQSYPNRNFGFVEPPPVVKRLYLHKLVDTTLLLNRNAHDPNEPEVGETINGWETWHTWALTPALAQDLVLVPGQTITVGLHVDAHSTGKPIYVRLHQGNVNAPFFNQSYGLPEGSLQYIELTAPVPAGTAINAGERVYLSIRIECNDWWCTAAEIMHKASRVDLPTYSYVDVQAGTYIGPYPDSRAMDAFQAGEPVFFRAQATDPFGAYDVTGATLSVPGVITNQAMSRYSPDPDAGTAIYEYSTAGLPLGSYTYVITATEGSEGTVRDVVTGTFRMIVSNLTNSYKEVRSWPERQLITQTVPGAEIEYTVHISNTGDYTATNVSLVDPIPAHASCDAGFNCYVVGAVYNDALNAIVWPGTVPTGIIPPRSEVTFTFRVRLDPVLDNGLVIENLAYINDGTNQFSRGSRTSIVSFPDLATSAKSVDRLTAEPGDVLAYTIALTNTEKMNASASFTDVVPANTTLMAGSLAWTAGYASYNDGNRTISWSGTVPGTAQGSTPTPVYVTFQARVAFPLDDGTPITNTAFIDDGFAPNGAAPLVRQTVTTITSEPLIQDYSSKIVDESPTTTPGATLHYHIYLMNGGKMNAPSVSLADLIPAHTTYVDGSLRTNGIGTATPPGGGNDFITWSGPVNPGAPVEIHFNARADSVLDNGLIITNTATVTDGFHAGSFPLTTTTTIASAPDLRASYKTVSPGTPVVPGQVLTYEIHLVNTGNMTAATHITDSLSTDLVNVTVVSPLEATYNPGSHTITWAGNVGPGPETILRFTAAVRNPLDAPQTLIYNTARINDGFHAPFDIYPPTQTTVNASPDLSTSRKAVNRLTGNPGDVLTYTITLTNTGNMNTMAWVQDGMPNQTTYLLNSLSASAGLASYDPFNRWIRWDGPANPGVPVVITYAVTIDPVMSQPDTTIYNDASVNDGVHASFITPGVTTIVHAEPDLSLSSKVVDLAEAAPGQQIWYRLTVHNSGNMIAQGVTVSDTLPAEVTYVSGVFPSGGGYSYVGRYVYWSGNVTPGTDVVIDYYATVNDPLDDDTLIANTAEIRDGYHSTPVVTTPPATTTVTSAPNLGSSTKTVDKGTAAPGDMLTYTITLLNTGSMNAHGARVTDTIPLNTNYVGPLDATSGTPSWDSANNRILWTGTVTRGVPVVITFRVAITSPLANGTEIRNYAQVSDGYHSDPLDLEPPLTIIGSAPNLSASSKTVDRATAEPGDVLTYTIALRNTGNENATVSLTDTLPLNVTYVPDSVTGGATHDGATLTWHGQLNAGAAVTFTYQVTVNLPLSNNTLIENSAAIDDGVHPAFDTSPRAQTLIHSAPDLVTSDKVVSRDMAAPGDTLVYTITLRNTGKMTAPAATMYDILPLELNDTLVGQPYASSGIVNYTSYNRRVLWNGSVSPLQPVTVVFTATVRSPLDDLTPIINIATVNDGTHAAFDTEPAITTVRSAPILTTSTKSVNLDHAAPGAQLLYTIRITNTGNMVAQASMVDELPSNVTYFSGPTVLPAIGTPSWDAFNNRILWNGPVSPATPVVIQYYVTVNNPTDDGTVITNTCDIVDGYPDHATYNPPAASTTINSAPSLNGSTKAVDKSTAAPGDELLYTITLANSGNMDAHGALITDTIPANTNYVEGSLSASGGWPTWDSGNNRILWTGDVAKGMPVVVTFRVWVTNPLTDSTRITNTALIDDNFAPNGTAALQRPVVTTIHSAPDLGSSTKAVNTATARPGEVLTYTITLINTGSQVARNAWVTDPLPANTSAVGNPTATSGTAAWNGSQMRWDGNVVPGTPVAISFSVRVNLPLDNNTTILNTATINDGFAGHSNLQRQATALIQSAPNLYTSAKAVNTTTASPGQIITYTITLTNTGDMNAAAYVLDSLPDHTSYVDFSARASSGSVSYDTLYRRISWSGTVPVGAPVVVTYQVRIDSPLDNGLVIWNTATVGDGVHAPFDTPVASTVISAAPNLTLHSTKTVNLSDVNAGGLLRYTITLVNDGSMVASSAQVIDVFPPQVTYGNWLGYSSGSATWDGANRILWSGAVAPGTPVTIQYDARVNDPLDDGTVITNTATVNDNFPGHVAFETTPAASTTVHGAPNLSTSTKGVDKTAAAPGDQLLYTITLNNTGNMNAHGARITDTIPVSTTYVADSVSANATYDSANNRILWNGDVVKGTPVVVTFRVTIASPLPNGAVIHNEAQIYDGFQLPVLSRTVNTVIGSAPNLQTSSKVVDRASAAPGDLLTYTITLHNTGNATASGARITDTLPANTTWNGWVTQNGAALNGNVITWQGNVTPGVDQVIAFRVQVNTPLDNNTVIANSAMVNDGVNPVLTIGPAQTTIGSAPNVTASSKAVDVTTAAPGQTLAYTITLRNTGNMVAHSAEVLDYIPAHSTYVANSVAASSGTADYQTLYNRIRWTGDIVPGTDVVITFRVLLGFPLDDETTISNWATVDDQFHTAPFETPVVDVTINSAPNLTLHSTKTVNLSDVNAGGLLRYTITLVNDGNMTASNAQVIDVFPPQVTYGNWLGYSSGSATWDGANRILWNGAVAPGTPVTIQYDARVNDPLDDGTLITNTATVNDNFPGHVAFETTPAASTRVHGAPDLSTSTKVVDKSTASPGAELLYTITLNNTGNMNAHGARITDTIPLSTTYVADSVSANATYDSANNRILWNGDVVKGTPVVVTFRVTINSPQQNGAVIHNEAQVYDGFQLPVLSLTASTTIGSAPDLATSSKEVNQTSAVPGDLLTYTITLRNTGNATASGARITDTLPANTTWNGWVTQNGATQSGGVITWQGNVQPGVNQVIAFRVQVNTPLDNGTTIQNVATVNDNFGHIPFVIASAQTTISSAPNVTASSKAVDVTAAAPGQTLAYTITLRNTGNMVAHNAEVLDYIPAHSTYVAGSVAASSGAAQHQPSYNRIYWTGDIAPGTDVVITFRVLLDFPLDNGTTISNGASVDDHFHTTPFETPVVDVTINSAPNLATSSKTVDLADAAPGQTLHYVITLRNTGNMTAGGARITDTIPANTTLIGTPSASSGVPTWDPIARRITWSNPVLPGIPVTIDYYVTAYTTLDDGVLITNTATVDDGRGHVFETDPPTVTTIHSAPDLHGSTKTVDRSMAAPGEVVEYTITLNNIGNMNAANALMTDTLPTEVGYEINSLIYTGGTASYDSVLREIHWTGAVNVGQSVTIQYQARLNNGLADGTRIENTATVDDGRGHVYETTPPASTTVGHGGLSVSLTDGRDTVQPGERITYTIAFSGVNPLNDGRVQIRIPANTTFVSAGDEVPSQVGNTLYWYLDPQGANFYGERYMVVTVNTPLDNGTLISTTAYLIGDGQSNSATDTDIVVSEPDLSTSVKTVSNPGARAGELVMYHIVLSNTGTMQAYQAIITDTIPASITLEGDPVASSGVVTFTDGDVRWNGQVLVGEPVEILFNARVAQDAVKGAFIENYVDINDGFHAGEFGRSVTITVGQGGAPVRGPIHLPILIRRGGTTPPPGGSYDIELTIYNCGIADAVGAFWVDLYINPNEQSIHWPPSNGEGYDWFGPNVTDGQGASFTVGTLGAGKSRTLHLSDALPAYKNVPTTLDGTPSLYGQVDWVDGGATAAGHGVVEEGTGGESNNFAGSGGATCAAAPGMPDLIIQSISVVSVAQQVAPAAALPALEGGAPAPERPRPPSGK